VTIAKGQLNRKLAQPQPFLKWAGGKRTLLPEIIARMPKKFNNYFEIAK